MMKLHPYNEMSASYQELKKSATHLTPFNVILLLSAKNIFIILEKISQNVALVWLDLCSQPN